MKPSTHFLIEESITLGLYLSQQDTIISLAESPEEYKGTIYENSCDYR